MSFYPLARLDAGPSARPGAARSLLIAANPPLPAIQLLVENVINGRYHFDRYCGSSKRGV